MKTNAIIKKIATNITAAGHVCDSCVGRQFALLIKAKTNAERGKKVREVLASEFKKGNIEADLSKLFGRRKGGPESRQNCVLCENVLENIPKMAEKPIKILKKMGFTTFMVGIKMSDSLVMNEEALWERAGMKYSEPLKSEISRELSALVEKKTGKKIRRDKPDVIITFDIQKGDAEIFSNPILIYGEYKKFERGLPQTSSPRYKQSVEDIIAKPFMRFTTASSHTLHAQGREDKEARCLAWRRFVLEIKQPMLRAVDLKKMKNEINKNSKVKVARLRYSDREEIFSIKTKNPFKVYRVLVDFEGPVENADRLKKILGTIKQSTPSRILGQKPDKTKYKKVKSIKWKRINTKRYQFEISVESGLYLQELITGDGGRTKPSVAHLLDNRAELKEFDLVGIED
jgi:tRNA pseudouridine synthase 10